MANKPQFTISKATIDILKMAAELSKSVGKGTIKFGEYAILNNDGTKTYRTKK
jgi:hypothetical protein